MSINNVIELDSEFEKAKAGRELWLSLSDKYSMDKDCGFIIFPEEDDVLNKETIGLLPAYMERFRLRAVYAVTDIETVAETIKGLSGEETVCIEITHTEMDNLLKYYQLVGFNTQNAVVSLKEPFGNDYLLKKKGISLKDFILSAVFKIR